VISLSFEKTWPFLFPQGLSAVPAEANQPFEFGKTVEPRQSSSSNCQGASEWGGRQGASPGMKLDSLPDREDLKAHSCLEFVDGRGSIQ
jgi:hypothetical protein